ncbi:hypothetical protein M231_06475 [Tremella mesenterica]|uniref:ASTRA-associated protein 1 n=1 Tax=Tremella mesenterica TaxID=5217 RepID=A0A4Q1BG86_TREME|nr:hypothetical protein M231_06475 [Tremella mesenterica]
MPTPPPPPFHLLRAHTSPISSVHFNPSNTLLYTGDQSGRISILDLRTRRVVAYWRAHSDSILTLTEWSGRLISHGRDNLIYIYEPIQLINSSSSLTAGTEGGLIPKIWKELSTNSLNFCKLSLVDIDHGKQGWMVVPNITNSELADMYHLPSLRRIYGAINYHPISSSDENQNRTGLIMSLHLHLFTSTSIHNGNLALALGYEDGKIEVWYCFNPDPKERWDGKLSEGRWKMVYCEKGHNESVMAMVVDQNFEKAFTVSADHLLVKYHLLIPPHLAQATPLNENTDSRSKPMDQDKYTTPSQINKPINISSDLINESPDTTQNPINESPDAPPIPNNDTPSIPRNPINETPSIPSTPINKNSRTHLTPINENPKTPLIKKHSTGQIGNSSLSISPQGSVIAVGGWDGKIRLYSTSTFKPLGILNYHRGTVNVLAFANPPSPPLPSPHLLLDNVSTVLLPDTESNQVGIEKSINNIEVKGLDKGINLTGGIDVGLKEKELDDKTIDMNMEEESDDELDQVGLRYRWFVSGGKDHRVALWSLMDFHHLS